MIIYFLLNLLLGTANAEVTYSCPTSYEALGIPRIRTVSIEASYYCFGLHHGRDRAWQMDYFRRIGEGRNAEIHGVSHLKSDLMMRLVNLPQEAKRLWEEFPQDKKSLLQLYARGVNEGFETGKLVREFLDLGITPRPWRPEDSLLVLLLQSFDQTRKTFTQDYDDEKLRHTWGDKARTLFGDGPLPWDNTILKDGEYLKREAMPVKTVQTLPLDFRLWAPIPTVFGRASGSNNWVVSKEKSRSGNALLANDPHLDLKTPLFWYWVSLETGDKKLVGASLPGVPVVASGTNGKVAWGLTNSYLNSADAVFVTDLREEQVETMRPWVWIKFGFIKLPFFFKSFEHLKTGERVLPLEHDGPHRLLLRWTGYSLTAKDLLPMFDLPSVENVSDMDRLLGGLGLPSWNFVFADRTGRIGYRLVGKTYKHTAPLPLGIQALKYEEFSQPAYLTPEERPRVIDPKRGYVYSANNRHWPNDGKFFGGRAYTASFRGFRIDELLAGPQDVESFKNIQCDRQVVDARFFLPKLRRYLPKLSLDWQKMDASDDSRDLPIYRRIMDRLLELWKLDEAALYRLLDELTPKQVQELEAIVAEAQKDIDSRSWGEVHKLSFPHLSKSERWKFAPEIPGVGDTHSVDPGTARWNKDRRVYEQSSGASMRMIVEMGQVPRIWLVLPGKNRDYQEASGGSPWLDWKRCQYTELKF